MSLLLNVLLAVCGLIYTLASFGGETWRKGEEPVIERITKRGWYALIALFLTFAVVVTKEIRNNRLSKKSENENVRQRTTISEMAQTITNLSEEVRAASAMSDEALTKSGTNPYVAIVKLEARIAAASEKRQKFETIYADSFDLEAAKEELKNRVEMDRLKAEKAQLEERLAAPAKQAAEKAARLAKEREQSEFLNQTAGALTHWFAYPIDRLKSMLSESVKVMGNNSKLISSCTDLSDLIANAGKCGIDQGENSPWTYEISMGIFDPSGISERLTVVCVDKVPILAKSGNQSLPEGVVARAVSTYTNTLFIGFSPGYGEVSTAVTIVSKTPNRNVTISDHQQISNYEQYQKLVDTALRMLVAAQAEEIAERRKLAEEAK